MTEFIANFTLNQTPQIEADFVINATNTKHQNLTGRDLSDQHPISAITGLEEALQEETGAISTEREERIAADEDLQNQIDDIVAGTVTDIIGGSNIEIERDGGVVTVNTATFIWEQGIASNTWVITHNLNKCPSITLVDSAGTQFEAHIEYNNLNTVTVYLNGASTGKAYLN